MSTAVVADAHLGGPGGDAELLATQLRTLPEAGCTRLVLLGDLCHVWVALPRFETPQARALLAAVRELRRQGLRVDYVEGNRDFFVARGPYAAEFDHVGQEVGFEEGGRRFLAVHGDGIDDRDWRYRTWRRLSKSAPSRAGMRLLPAALARRLVAGTEARLARSNFKHKQRMPEEVIRAYGRRRLAEGHDVLLLGHFHEAGRWEVAGGEVRVFDAWFRSRRIEWPGREA